MKKWRLPGYGIQIALLRAALAGLSLVLALSLVATVTNAAGQRDMAVTIQYHGKTIRTTATSGTVGEMLTRLGLELSGEDVVSHGMEDGVEEEMVVVIDRVVEAQEVYTAAIPCAVSYCWDPSIRKGVEEVLVSGADGEMRCTANVTYVNGKEVSRQVIAQDVIKPAVDRMVARGTMENLVGAKEDAIIADGYITLATGEVLTYTEVRTVTASAYSHMDKGCDSITATGKQVHWGTVAVNPNEIPYGTRMFITTSDGSFVYGIATAEDFGGGKDRIDLYMPTYNECIQFGRQECTVYFLG